MSMMSCPRCKAGMNLGTCPKCSVDTVSDEMGVRLSPEERAERIECTRRHLRELEHSDLVRISNREKLRTLVAVEGSERFLQDAKDHIDWLCFHLDRASYPKSVIFLARRLQALIALKARIQHRKGIAI